MITGEAVPVRDAEAKVRGTLAYTGDLALPGMLHLKLVRSPHPHARLLSLNAEDARRQPGVLAVLSGADLPTLTVKPAYGLLIADQPVLAVDRVRFYGEPVAAVIAETARAARQAAEIISPAYEALPGVFSEAEARTQDAPRVHEGRPSNLFKHGKLRRGDMEAGFAAADVVIEETYTSPSAHHATLEPHACIALWQGDRLTVWSATQAPFAVRKALADLFGLPEAHIRVIVLPLGGGYGGKGHIRIEPVTAAAARLVPGRPVRLALTRQETFYVNSKHAGTITIKSGVKRDGTLTARQVTLHWNGGAYADVSPILVSASVVRCLGPYNIPNVHVDAYGYYTNLPPAGAFRGAISSQTTWAYESHTDSLAAAIGMTPHAFRLKNILYDHDHFATGEEMHDVHFERCLSAVVEKLEDIPQGQPSAPHKRRGRGHAVMMKSTVPSSRSDVTLALDAQGRLQAALSTVEMGQGAHTILAQMAAEALGARFEDVQVTSPDTQTTPFDSMSSASRSTGAMSVAINQAGQELRHKLLTLAAPILEEPAENLTAQGGYVISISDPAQRVSFAEVLRRHSLDALSAEGTYQTNLSMDPETGQGVATPHWHQGAGACEIEIDMETGRIEVLHYFGASYAGQVIHPVLAKLQNDGNVIYGLGPTFAEQVVQQDGVLLNPNLADYKIPALRDLPRSLETFSLETPGGEVHGIGEMTLPPVSPAIGNAIFDALGIRIYDLPLTPERVLRAISQAEDKQP